MTDRLAAVVLAAGAGTRLRPLTTILPKALCPVGNVALVDLAIDREVGRLPAAFGGLYEACWGPRWAEGRLELVPGAGPFFDCGTPADYLAANLAASGGASVVGEGARVEGELVRSVVWPGGVVHRGERLVECIRVGEDLTVAAGS